MPPRDRFRVLLIWPGGPLGGLSNFGVPQLLSLASAVRRSTDADVSIADLDFERALGALNLAQLCAGYDLIGLSCYSSFDYLKVMALAAHIREVAPRAKLVTGGYHASARPDDFTHPGSSFDYVIVGDGEAPLARLVAQLIRGQRPLNRVLPAEPVPSPSELLPHDFGLLARYLPVARRVASQAEIYLSRGCPYDCSFCMERAKRETSWRAITPQEAVESLQQLDSFLDLRGWTVFVADALFGMKRAWRREFLEGLAAQPLRALRIWLLIRVDLIEREDIALMARANVSPGFGLESGDPEQLKRIRKTGALQGYLEKMVQVSEWARELDVPFGANIIVGHPGETERSLRTSAAYMRRVFVEPSQGTHGFLSVDPFRLYPGSPIDQERGRWEQETGMVVHHYPWWHDGDQAFLSEWVDPSAELDYRRTRTLQHELFDGILHDIKARFAYHGPARDYFMGAIDQQIAETRPRARVAKLGLHHLWQGLSRSNSSGMARSRLAADTEFSRVAKAARRELAQELTRREDVRRAIEVVPRERFVPLESVWESAEDRALPLTADGLSSISAIHAYARAMEWLSLREGDQLVELGAGTGYGAALAAEVVGPSGSVLAVEVQAELLAQLTENLADYSNVRVQLAEASAAHLCGAGKVLVSYALERLPESWLQALADDAIILAPIGRDAQYMTLFRKSAGVISSTRLARVVFVADRGGARTAYAPQALESLAVQNALGQ